MLSPKHPGLPRAKEAKLFFPILVNVYFFFVWGLFTSSHLKSDGNVTSGEKHESMWVWFSISLCTVEHFSVDAGQMKEYFSTLIRHSSGIVGSRERACPYQEGCISFSIDDRGDGYVPIAGRLYYDLNTYLTAFLIRWLFVKRLHESSLQKQCRVTWRDTAAVWLPWWLWTRTSTTTNLKIIEFSYQWNTIFK